MANLITGLFDTEGAAENAVDRLKAIGYTESEISIIMKDRAAAVELADATGTSTMAGIGTGAAIGGTLGAVLGGLLAVGSVTIPGIGLVAGGALAAMLAGAGAGGLAGSLFGWLVSMGIPEDVAPYYERGLGEGGVVVAVAARPGDEMRVRQALEGMSVAMGGYNVPSYVAPNYAARYNDLTPPATVYNPGTYPATPYDSEAQRTVNSMTAEQRSAQRTAEAQTRAAHREANDRNVIDDIGTAVTNTADNTTTALKNQADKVSTGVSNTVDRTTNP